MIESGRFAIVSFITFLALATATFCVADSSLVTTAPIAPAKVSVMPVCDNTAPVCDNTVPVCDNAVPVKVELHTEPSESVVPQGDEFLLTFKIIYYGPNSYWHVKSINGPVLKGVVQRSHAVSSIVGRTSEGVICEEIHKLHLVATGTETGTIGSVAVVLVGKDGAIRHLQSNPLQIKIEPALFDGYVKLPVLWIVIFTGALLLLLLLGIILRFRIASQRIAREMDENFVDTSIAAKSERLLLAIDEINSPSAFEDVKKFYKKSIEIIKQGLELNAVSFDKRDVDSLIGHLQDVPNMSASLESGLKKVVSDENLVRFAGSKPSIEECEQVCSRLKEFITLNIDSE